MVPGSPRSGPSAESSQGPQPGRVLPAGTQSGIATADEFNNDDIVVRSILDKYLDRVQPGAAAPGSPLIGGNPMDDGMSVSSIGG